MIDWFAIAASALDQSLVIMGEEFEYQGQQFKGVINQTETSELLDYGGFQSHVVCSVYVQKAGFPIPVKGDRMTIRGVDYRIVKTADHPVSWTIFLEDISR
jgi:hypothetical protein